MSMGAIFLGALGLLYIVGYFIVRIAPSVAEKEYFPKWSFSILMGVIAFLAFAAIFVLDRALSTEPLFASATQFWIIATIFSIGLLLTSRQRLRIVLHKDKIIIGGGGMYSANTIFDLNDITDIGFNSLFERSGRGKLFIATSPTNMRALSGFYFDRETIATLIKDLRERSTAVKLNPDAEQLLAST